MAEPKEIRVLPGECMLLVRLDGTEGHIQELGHFLRAPQRFGISLGPGFHPDPSEIMDVPCVADDVLGVMPGGRLVHYAADDFELLVAPVEGRG